MNEKTIWIFQHLQQQIDELQATIKRMNGAEAPSLIEIDMIASQLASCYSQLMGLRHHKVEAAVQQLDRQATEHTVAPKSTVHQPVYGSATVAAPKPTAAPIAEPITKEEREATPQEASVVVADTPADKAKSIVQAVEKEPATISATAPNLSSPTQEAEDMNAKLGKMQIQPSVVDKLSSRVNSLQASIGINDKFLFVNNLFDGQEDTYKRSIKALNNCQHMAEAQALLNSMATERQWAADEPALEHLQKLLRQSYGL